MELTRNNHFEFGRLPENRQCFCSVIGECKGNTLSCIDQAAIEARYIFATSGYKEIDLCLSGGIDSEAMLESFVKANVPIRANFFRYNQGLNDFDIQTNIEKVQQLKLKYRVFDFDILDFFESGKFLEIATNYECQSPQIAAHLWMLEQVEGFVCLGGNPIAPIWRNSSWFFVGLPGELHSAYFKFFLINNRPGVPWFFIYSPELIKSFFALPCMQPYLAKKIVDPAQYTYLEKCKSYKEGGFSARPRQDKFTGFEVIRAHYDKLLNTQYGVGFDQKFRIPLVEKFPFPESYYQLIPKGLLDGN